MNARLPILVLATLLAGLALGPAEAQESGRTIPVAVFLHDNPHHLVPERVNARVGDTLEFTVTNAGTSPHNLIVCGDGANPASACDERWAFTPMLQPNGTAQMTVTLTEAGTFEYYCDIVGHKAGGMVGTLVVEGGEAGTKESPGFALGFALLAAAAGAVALRRR